MTKKSSKIKIRKVKKIEQDSSGKFKILYDKDTISSKNSIEEVLSDPLLASTFEVPSIEQPSSFVLKQRQ